MTVNSSFHTVLGHAINNDPVTEEECMSLYMNSTGTGAHCPTAWDSISCWPPTARNSTVSRLCSSLGLWSAELAQRFSDENLSEPHAFRVCSEDSTWLWGNWTNYSKCLEALNTDTNRDIPNILLLILFVGSTISLTLLMVTLFIFSYFKSIHCARLQVHKNLVCALVLHSMFLQLCAAPGVYRMNLEYTRQSEWICKLIIFGEIYSSMATINWMFVEGLLLHSRIAISVFRHETPLKLYYFIGWISPLLFLSIWTYLTETTENDVCWHGYGKSRFIWIITVPMFAVLAVNAVFLVNIIRILLEKLRGNSSVEMMQVSKAAKATALLFPLLGIPHLLFCINPGENSELQTTYLIFNAVLKSSQGIFVSILYCFLNSEVQQVVYSAYLRAVIRRNPNRKFSRGRTLSRTSTTFLSTNDRQRADSIYPLNSKQDRL